MTTHQTIFLNLVNPVRRALLVEQLHVINKDVCVVDDYHHADLMVTEDGDDHHSDARHACVYLQKGPLRLGDIIDRIRYALSGRTRHVELVQNMVLGSFILYPNENVLVHCESTDTIPLTDKERLLLRILYEAPDHTLDKTTLLKRVWNYAETTETHTFETHLYRLRQKLEPYKAQGLIKADGAGNYSLQLT